MMTEPSKRETCRCVVYFGWLLNPMDESTATSVAFKQVN
jgi:hypothetical protein